MQDNTRKTEKRYIMINEKNGARIECTEKYMVRWLERGFEVEEIRYDGASDSAE